MLMTLQVAGLVVELRSRVYDVYVCVYLTADIGQIYLGYVTCPFLSMRELKFACSMSPVEVVITHFS